METALRLFSWHGIKQETVLAGDIRSREDARKLGPFVDPSGRREVHWRKPSFDEESRRRIRRAHFAHYPSNSDGRHFDSGFLHFDTVSIDNDKRKETRHGLAVAAIVSALQSLMARGRSADWAYTDPRISNDAPLSGNLLQDVTEIAVEYTYRIAAVGGSYRFDIALLGPKVGKSKAILAVIEVELTHAYDVKKCLAAKSLGFPLLSVNIDELEEDEISEAWAVETLLGRTTSRSDRRRLNYIYLHDMLAPIFLDIDFADKHEYVVFVGNGKHEFACNQLKRLKTHLGFSPDDPAILIQQIGIRNDQGRKIVENEGSIAGRDWAAFNSSQYIRIVLERPRLKAGPIYLYHLQMAMLLNSCLSCLVGYKYRKGIKNKNPGEPLWNVSCREHGTTCRLPKQVSQPLAQILDELAKLTK